MPPLSEMLSFSSCLFKPLPPGSPVSKTYSKIHFNFICWADIIISNDKIVLYLKQMENTKIWKVTSDFLNQLYRQVNKYMFNIYRHTGP